MKKDKKYEKSLKKTKSCARKGHYNTLVVFGGCGVPPPRDGLGGAKRNGGGLWTRDGLGGGSMDARRFGWREGVFRCPSKTDWVMGEGGYLIGEFYLNE